MRQRYNGFHKFMARLDGKKLKEFDTPSSWFYSGSVNSIDSERLIDAINECSEGLTSEALWDAFTWRFTSQGYTYWEEIAEGHAFASDDDIDYMNWLEDLIR